MIRVSELEGWRGYAVGRVYVSLLAVVCVESRSEEYKQSGKNYTSLFYLCSCWRLVVVVVAWVCVTMILLLRGWSPSNTT